MIIGLCGKKQSGKDTLAKYLVEQAGFKRISIASKVKEVARDLFDINIPEIHHYDISISDRQVLQLIATKLKEIDEEVWIKFALKQIDFLQRLGNKNIVLTDCRYLSEIQKLKDQGAQIWKLLRQIDNDPHISEAGIDNISNELFDIIIDNREWTADQFNAECMRLAATF